MLHVNTVLSSLVFSPRAIVTGLRARPLAGRFSMRVTIYTNPVPVCGTLTVLSHERHLRAISPDWSPLGSDRVVSIYLINFELTLSFRQLSFYFVVSLTELILKNFRL